MSAGRSTSWGYAAFAVGVLYALVSAYWGAGGTLGLDTLGGELEDLARDRDPALIAVVWLTAGLKAIGAVLALAVVQPWGRRLPRRPLRAAAWGASAVLVLYGGALVVGQALLEAGVIEPAADGDRQAVRWHLFLWDPWFLIWGLLLGMATWLSAGERAPRAERA
jgi:amino acid transporter